MDVLGAVATGDGLRLQNRLGESQSPYVRGHMDNPVAWQTWGPEALELARTSNRLIFLSIGYAACHWCHVMERESFANHEVANILNESFIPIKIDREERPDVDRIYMNYVQALSGQGGWPLNVFLTPHLQPIFGGTYFAGPGSTAAHGGQPGFIEILAKIRAVWRDERRKCLESAQEETKKLFDFAQDGNISRQDGAEHDGLELEVLDDALEHFKRKYDPVHAGFGDAPKFPTPSNLQFLLKLSRYPGAVIDVLGAEDCAYAKSMVLNTLDAMSKGGVHDQIGHGFARYSVTANWSLPHFEKMLYDQAQLLPVYLDAYLLTKNPDYLAVVHDIATYLTSHPIHADHGGFFSSEDADSLYRPTDQEKREGAFYVWTLQEFQDIVGERDADILARYYNVKDEGNVSPDHDAHDEFINQNVLAITTSPSELAKQFGLSEDEVHRILSTGRQKLLEHRNRERPRPALDDKVVVSWNGLAIGALARTAAALSSQDASRSKTYLGAAEKAALFLKENLYNADSKTLTRMYRQDPSTTPGFADDYAYLISGLIDLYQATFNDTYLHWADDLQTSQLALFWDHTHLGFFSTPPHQPDLLMRLKDGMDNAEPSTNGVSARNLDRLAALLGDEAFAQKARDTTSAFEAEIMQHPFLFPSMMDAVVGASFGLDNLVIKLAAAADQERQPRAVATVLAARERAVRGFRERPQGLGTICMVGEGVGTWLESRNRALRGMRCGVWVCGLGRCREAEMEAETERNGRFGVGGGLRDALDRGQGI